ncbi:MAG: ABC transporter permease [Candidatus Krumholzibacteriota bacterium]|nr:ABC transporter permease [Candidatus Krumholzibacteriota bacterium]
MKISCWVNIKRGLMVPLAAIILWQLISSSGLVNPLYIPSPYLVGNAVLRLFGEADFWKGAGATLWRMFAGFAVAASAGIPIGIVLGYMKRAYKYSEFLIDFSRSIPATALYPLFILAFGIGDSSKVAIVSFACFFVILINSIYGVWNAPKTRVIMAKAFRANDYQIFTKIILFDALPQIFAGLRNALSIALIMTVVAEMFIGTNRGLGFLIMNSKLAYDTPTMYAVIIILGAIGYIASRGLLYTEKMVIHWSRV